MNSVFILLCLLFLKCSCDEFVDKPDPGFKLFSIDDPGYSVISKWSWGDLKSDRETDIKTTFQMGYIFVYMTIHPFKLNVTLSAHEKMLFSDANVVKNEYLPRFSGIIGNILVKADYGEYQKRQVMYVAVNRDMNAIALFPNKWHIGSELNETESLDFTLEIDCDQTVMWPIGKGYTYGIIEP